MYHNPEADQGGSIESKEQLKHFFIWAVIYPKGGGDRNIVDVELIALCKTRIPDKNSAISEAKAQLDKALNGKARFRSAPLMAEVGEIKNADSDEQESRLIWGCKWDERQGREINGKWERDGTAY